MPFDDISPPNQPFSHAFRPLSFQWEEGEKNTICTIIYGFGEYQFSTDLTQYDSKADFAYLLNQLESKNAFSTDVTFENDKEKIVFKIEGEDAFLSFSWWQEIQDKQTQLLEGETSRQQLLSLIYSLKNL